MSETSPHPAALNHQSLLSECSVTRLRRSGPGGQHRNKVETAVRLLHRPTGVVAEASERRSQSDNLAVATRRLRVTLAIDVRCRPADAKPSPLWQSRCRKGQIVISVEHEDFPPILAEALDRLATESWNAAAASDVLGCHTSQLVKLLKKEPRALALLNRHRRDAGLPPLK